MTGDWQQSLHGDNVIALLKACANGKDLRKCIMIHAEIAKWGFHKTNIVLGNSLVNVYAKCGEFVKAHQVFDELDVQDVVSWNTLIGGYAKSGRGREALICYEEMNIRGVTPTPVTFVSILTACGSIGANNEGQKIHDTVVKAGLLGRNCAVGNALLSMYTKFGELGKAREVFEKMPIQNVVTWTVLISAYVDHGHNEDALEGFRQMQLKGLSPDAVTFVSALTACGNIGATLKGQQIHDAIIKKQLLEKHYVLGNALVNMYSQCGVLSKAQDVFDNLLHQDLFSWTSLINGYAQYRFSDEAIECFDRLQLECLCPSAATFVCILKAIGNIGTVLKGRHLHIKVVVADLLEEDNVSSALVNMYLKCGAFAEARELFVKFPEQGISSWNVLISGHAQSGEEGNVFKLLDKMMSEGKDPNYVTFTIVLNVCNHVGLLEEFLMYVEMMIMNFNIIPTLEHHSCMVDLFGRAGDLDKAVQIINNMPFKADHHIWITLLGVCQKTRNVKLGEFAFQHAVNLDDGDASTYICMSNIYEDTETAD